MSYNEEEIMRRLRLGEDSAWEFKQVEFSGDRPTSPRREDWANEIAAFANASGGALLCGVSDDGEAQGMSRQQITNLDALLVEICTDAIKPPVRISTYHRELADGKPVLLVEVPPGDSLHEAPGGSYIRVGASKCRMTRDERLRLAQKRGQALPLVRRAAGGGHGISDAGRGTLEASVERRGRCRSRVGADKIGSPGPRRHRRDPCHRFRPPAV